MVVLGEVTRTGSGAATSVVGTVVEESRVVGAVLLVVVEFAAELQPAPTSANAVSHTATPRGRPAPRRLPSMPTMLGATPPIMRSPCASGSTRPARRAVR